MIEVGDGVRQGNTDVEKDDFDREVIEDRRDVIFAVKRFCEVQSTFPEKIFRFPTAVVDFVSVIWRMSKQKKYNITLTNICSEI